MNRQYDDRAALALWGLILSLIGALVVAQCSGRHEAPIAAEIIDTGAIVIDTCQPMPQCVDPVPGTHETRGW